MRRLAIFLLIVTTSSAAWADAGADASVDAADGSDMDAADANQPDATVITDAEGPVTYRDDAADPPDSADASRSSGPSTPASGCAIAPVSTSQQMPLTFAFGLLLWLRRRSPSKS